jgi:hypothetical protein
MKARLLTLKAYSGFGHRVTYLARTVLDPQPKRWFAPELSMSRMRTQRVFHVAKQAISDFCKPQRN